MVGVDVAGLVQLSVVQAAAEGGAHTLPGRAEVEARGAEAALLTGALALAARLGRGQGAAGAAARAPARLEHPAPATLHLWRAGKTRDELSCIDPPRFSLQWFAPRMMQCFSKNIDRKIYKYIDHKTLI